MINFGEGEFPMIAELKVGVQTNADGAQITARAGKDGEVIAQDGHARYQEAVYRGNVFSTMNTVGQAVSVALATAYTGLALYNPINSGKNLVLFSVGVTPTVAIGSAIVGNVGLMVGVGPNFAAPTTVTTANIYNNLLNGAAASVAKAYTTATLTPAPTLFKNLVSYLGAAVDAQVFAASTFELAGQIILPPGSLIAVYSLTALTIAADFTWEEINI
jgi:hypothetical protein